MPEAQLEPGWLLSEHQGTRAGYRTEGKAGFIPALSHSQIFLQ